MPILQTGPTTMWQLGLTRERRASRTYKAGIETYLPTDILNSNQQITMPLAQIPRV